MSNVVKPNFYNHKEGPAQEQDVGIVCYLSGNARNSGFDGIFKHRFTDFIVRELNQAGEPCRLTEQQQELQPGIVAEAPAAASGEAEARQKLEAVLGAELSQLEEFVGGTGGDKFTVATGAGDKLVRGSIHQGIRAYFGPDHIHTTTVDGAVVVLRGPDKRYRSNKTQWPKNRPKYLHFVMAKRNTDTASAINKLCRTLNEKPRMFAWAGTKDKRAITAQRVSAKMLDAVRLQTSALHLNDSLKVGQFSYQKEGLVLGQLSGNQFEIVLRYVRAEGGEAQISRSLQQLESTGFINYYGLQRFGSWGVPTHVVGLALLKGEACEACDLILFNAYPGWLPKRDARAAEQVLEKRHHIERSIVRSLLKKPGQYKEAIARLPSQSRSLYIHAYQSYIWNCAVTRRLELYGSSPVVGDVVMSKDSIRDTYGHEASKGATQMDLSQKAKVELITEETLKEYTLADVIMPIIGSEQLVLPGHQAAFSYARLLEKDQLSQEQFISSCMHYGARGGYRPLAVSPGEHSGSLCKYSKDTTLISSEFEEHTQTGEEGLYFAVKLKFQLRPGAYATMLLRELMKRPTNRRYWMQQSDLYEEAKSKQPGYVPRQNKRPFIETKGASEHRAHKHRKPAGTSGKRRNSKGGGGGGNSGKRRNSKGGGGGGGILGDKPEGYLPKRPKQ